MDPGVEGLKYDASGFGNVLIIGADSSKRTELISVVKK